MEASDVFEEWNEYSKKKKLLGRDISLDRMIGNSERTICAVSGIRRSGKSSILMLIAQQLRLSGKKVAYINLEDGRMKNFSKNFSAIVMRARSDRNYDTITKRKELLDEVIKWFGDEGYLLLDEITSIDDWESWLARIHEMLKGRLRIFVTSSRSGLAVPSKPLRGRILPYELNTISFPEFLRFKSIEIEKTTAGKGLNEKAFSEYLKLGGFPDVVFATDETDKVMLLNAYFKDILGLDVAELAHEDVSIVETFGRYVLQGGYFSASKCLNFFKTIGQKIGKEKILALEHYSEEAFLFFFVPIFSYNIKDRAQYPRKAYSGDTGFYYAVAGKQEIGRLFENVVYLELRRRSQGQMQISYWKNKDGLEVDFVVKQGSNIREIIQVSYDMNEEKTRGRELDSAIACAKELGCKEALVITKEEKGQIEMDGIKIRIIPLAEWLMK